MLDLRLLLSSGTHVSEAQFRPFAFIKKGNQNIGINPPPPYFNMFVFLYEGAPHCCQFVP